MRGRGRNQPFTRLLFDSLLKDFNEAINQQGEEGWDSEDDGDDEKDDGEEEEEEVSMNRQGSQNASLVPPFFVRAE